MSDYFIRGTFTRWNLDFCQDVRHLLEEGFHMISIEPVVADSRLPYSIRAEDISIIEKEYEALTAYWLAQKLNAQEFSFFHFNIDLNQGPCLPKRLSGCGAGQEYLAVSPYGILYPCHQFMGEAEFEIGNVFDGIIRRDISRTFRSNHVLYKETCKSCWARFYCGGGCHANAWRQNGVISSPYEIGCLLEKKRIECSIYLKTKLYETQ